MTTDRVDRFAPIETINAGPPDIEAPRRCPEIRVENRGAWVAASVVESRSNVPHR
jgi:hypothetical protein